jgi:serine-type D-Ala-D-Ala carboxypeptidase (penicillin-binding protein 5/6)
MSARRPLTAAAVGALLAFALPTPAAAAAGANHRDAAAPQPEVQGARAWALIDARNGEVLLSHAARRKLPIASTTKLMTTYVVLHELPLRRIVRASRYIPEYGESLLGLRVGQRISVRDLLYGLILRSGNDAAYDLARAAAGSEHRFVGQMNRYAAALGLVDTHYANPIGLDQRGNHSSALDLATLARHLLRMPVFARIADSRRAVLRSVHPRRRIASVNELLGMAPWVNGVKTGHTFKARYVLVGSGRRRGVELIAVVVGAWTDEELFDDTLRLLDYGFSLYRRRLPIRRGQDLAGPSIRYAGGTLPLQSPKTIAVGVASGERTGLRVRAPATVEGPIRRGARLGTAIVLLDGYRAGAVPLLAARAIPAAGTLERARDFVRREWIWLAMGACVILIGAAGLWRRRRRGAAGEDEIAIAEEGAVSGQAGDGGAPK